MELDKIPQNCGDFKCDRAFEVLKLVEQARERYNQSLKGEANVAQKIIINNCIKKHQESNCYAEYNNIFVKEFLSIEINQF